MEARKCKITGSRLNDIVIKRGTGQKKGFYELIAERLALPPDGEDVMDRGNRLEDEAIEMFKKETGKDVDTSLVIWTRDDNESIAISPDGFIGETEAVEAKCLCSANHIESYLTQDYPKTSTQYNSYIMQSRQYFIVNDKLEKLHVVFYDPRLQFKNFFYFTLTRPVLEAEIKNYLEYQRTTLEEVDKIVNELSF